MLAVLLILLLAAPPSDGEIPSADASPAIVERRTVPLVSPEVEAFLARYFEEAKALSPTVATNADDHRFDHRLEIDISEEHRSAVASLNRRYLDEMDGFPQAQLTTSDRTNLDILRWTLEQELALIELPSHLIPLNQMFSMQITFVQMGSGAGTHPFNSRQDYENFRSRMSDFATWVDVAIANMERGMTEGIVLPAVIVDRVLAQVSAIAAQSAPESPFARPLESLPDEIDDAASYRSAYLSDVENIVLPSFQRLERFLADTYRPAARDTDGIGALPEGRSMYREWVRFWTTTDRSPDEIHELGLSEVDRILSRMEALRERIGFEGSLKELSQHFQSEPGMYPFSEPQEVLDAFAALEETMSPQLERLFNIRPDMPFEVRQIEAFRAASASAHYQPGSRDGSRPGVFYVPIQDASRYSLSGMESLFIHEAIPGHHYQIALQTEMNGLPDFRRYGFYSAFLEGWALYAESLGSELGLYQEAYSEWAMLGSELFRAVRLVVDTGMHWKGWTRQEAAQYLIDTMPGAGPGAMGFAMNQMERYMVLPGQALAYKVGERTIMRLRKEAEAELGGRFDIRAFHDVILTGGAMPLSVLESRVDAWIASRM